MSVSRTNDEVMDLNITKKKRCRHIKSISQFRIKLRMQMNPDKSEKVQFYSSFVARPRLCRIKWKIRQGIITAGANDGLLHKTRRRNNRKYK